MHRRDIHRHCNLEMKCFMCGELDEKIEALESERDTWKALAEKLAEILGKEHLENVEGWTIHIKDKPDCKVCNLLFSQAREERK